MGGHVLFFIHGVGEHATDWAEKPQGPIETLKAASSQYAYFGNGDLASRVDMVSIQYDAIFKDVVAKWKANAASIKEFDETNQLRNALDWLSDADEKKFWWSHVADVILYRFSAPYRQLVRLHVIKQMAERIEKEWDAEGTATCSVIAHSLGTAVAHDCLHYLGSTKWGKASSPFNPRHWRFQHVFMVANTSRLLQTDDEGMAAAYKSIVRPGPVEDPDSYCGTYWNFRHEYDPIAIPRRFDAAGWNGYTLEEVAHYHEANIHSLSHYLKHPKVHVPILRKTVRSTAVTDEEFHKAVNPDNFPQFGKGIDVTKAKKHLLNLAKQKLAIGEDPTNKAFVKMLLNVYALLKEAKA
jgi:hypothetical protein